MAESSIKKFDEKSIEEDLKKLFDLLKCKCLGVVCDASD